MKRMLYFGSYTHSLTMLRDTDVIEVINDDLWTCDATLEPKSLNISAVAH